MHTPQSVGHPRFITLWLYLKVVSSRHNGNEGCATRQETSRLSPDFPRISKVDKILDSGELWPSLPGVSDAYYGAGQYLTDISPSDASTRTKGQLSYALYSVPFKWLGSDVGYLEFSLPQNSVRRVAPVYGPSFPGKSIYLHSSLLGLAISGNLSGSGLVSFLPGQ